MSIRTIQCYDGKDVSDISADIVPEVPLRLYLNGKLLITIACAGIHLQELAVGFLRSEDIVTEISDMNDIRITEGDEPSVYVSTTVRRRSDQTLKTLGSSGARGKRDGNEVFERFPHPGIVLTPKHILNLMEQLEEAATIHKATRGTHCSGLADASGMLIAREDIGRHNTIDMLCGHMLMEGIKSSDKAIVTTGRVSSEIVLKVRRDRKSVV